MSPSTLLNALAVATISALSVSAQGVNDPTRTFPATPLAEKTFAYPDGIPYQVDTDRLIRGVQYGFNQCNSTTENQESNCQTAFVNSIDDFCLWGPPEPNSHVGDTEGESVAYCTKPGRGTRLIPQGALKGVQFMRTGAYVQVVGFIDQTAINIAAGDYGGEMDPHGADLRGNPLGGLLYSNAFSGSENQFDQVIEWHNFMGADQFCIKACDQRNPDAAHYCEHIYDRIGCAYNAPHNAQNGTFESCEGEVQDFPGTYTGSDGQVSTYTQPGEGTVPTPGSTYTARVPASSNCVAHTSSVLYAALPSNSNAPSASATPSGSQSGSNGNGSGRPTGSVTRTGSNAGPSATGGADGDNGAASMALSTTGLFAALLSAYFLL